MDKKLKLMLCSLKNKDILRFIDSFAAESKIPFTKTIHQISFNCYEAVCQFGHRAISGYGKTSSQAFINSVRTISELLVAEGEHYHAIIRQCFRKLNAGTNVNAGCINNNSGTINNIANTTANVNTNSQANLVENESRKRLVSTEKTFKTCNNERVPRKEGEEKPTLKQEIFSYLNLDNLRIYNPNNSHKARPHEKYMSQSTIQDQPNDEQQIQEIYSRIYQLEAELREANAENDRLKARLKIQFDPRYSLTIDQAKVAEPTILTKAQLLEQKKYDANRSPQEKKELQRTVMNNKETENLIFLKNLARQNFAREEKGRQKYEQKERQRMVLAEKQASNRQQHQKMRSISVQNCKQGKHGDSKAVRQEVEAYKIRDQIEGHNRIRIPKLNLEMLPNYHGKSNKSLNQSLLEAYEKVRK